MGACHSQRAHPNPYPPPPLPATQVRSQVKHQAYPTVVSIDQPPVILSNMPRRGKGKMVVKSVELTPTGRNVTRTYYEYGGKATKPKKGYKKRK